MKHWFKRLLLMVGIMILTVGVFSTINAQANDPNQPDLEKPLERGPIQVGEIEQKQFAFSYPMLLKGPQTIRYPDAAYIKLHIASLDLMPGDYITVSDPGRDQVYEYPGTSYTFDEDQGFWAVSIIGDAAVIQLHSANRTELSSEPVFRDVYHKAQAGEPQASLGITVDRYARGYPTDQFEEILLGIESTCGTNQRTDVVCYQSTHPTEYNKSHAVSRLLIGGTSLCTAWRASSLNRVFTNEHCITSQTDVDATEAWFNYQNQTCGGSDLATTTIVTGDELLADNYDLDFALITVNNFANISGFGYLEVDPRTPLLNEEIYIPQHGNGNPKEFGIESDMNTGNVCRIDDAIRNGRAVDSDTGYFCDTIGGSSGSPVLARSNHKVIALHHFGTGGAACDSVNMNAGVRMDLIWPLVEDFFTVVSDVGPLVYNGHTIDDDNVADSSGNGDGSADCGETIELYVDLYNQGTDTAAGVNATLSTVDPYVSFPINTSSSYPDIPGLSTRTNNDDFEVAFHPETPDGHVVIFNLEMTAANGGPWSDSFTIPVSCAPDEPDIWLNWSIITSGQMPDETRVRDFVIGNSGLQDLDWKLYEHLPESVLDDTAFRSDIRIDPLTAFEAHNPHEPRMESASDQIEAVMLAPNPESTLYSNGPFINSPGTGFAGADESILQSTSLGMNILGFGNQYDHGWRIADEFTIADSEGWNIDSITFYAYQTGSTTLSTIHHINLRIWDGQPGAGGSVIWGDTTTDRLTASGWSGSYRVSEEDAGVSIDRPVMASTATINLYLPPGTYWLDWQADGSDLYSGPWAPPITIDGLTTTGNAVQYDPNAASWVEVIDDGTSTQQGFPFVIEGRIPISGCANQDLAWLSASPLSGTLSYGESQIVELTFDSTGLSDGLYTGDLCIESNDPDEDPLLVPVTMEVSSLYKFYLPVSINND